MRSGHQSRILRVILAGVFFISNLPLSSLAQGIASPTPTAMLTPLTVRQPSLAGITFNPDDAFRMDFIVDRAGQPLEGKALEVEAMRFIKYFLAALTVPEKDMWVNLSPYEKDRIIPDTFGLTAMGRDLLQQDQVLKQMASEKTHPDKDVGKIFWKRVYERSYKEFGTTDVPMDTFNKVWIVPEKAIVYEKGQGAFLAYTHLKVMLEVDYFALEKSEVGSQKSEAVTGERSSDLKPLTSDQEQAQDISKQVMREVVIPEIEREVNEGAAFTTLRQIYASLALANWFKRRLKDSVLGKAYADRNKVSGVDDVSPGDKQAIYQQYLETYRKGFYNLIKEEYDTFSEEVIPRKYFSGGFQDAAQALEIVSNFAELTDKAQENLKSTNDTLEIKTMMDPATKGLEQTTERLKVIELFGPEIKIAFDKLQSHPVEGYPAGVDQHLDSLQALLTSLYDKGYLSADEVSTMRLFAKLHDSGYALNPADPLLGDDLEEVWRTIGELSGLDSKTAAERAIKARQTMEYYSNLPKLIEDISQELMKIDPQLSSKDAQKKAVPIAGTRSYLVTKVIGHGTVGIIANKQRLMDAGLAPEAALGLAFIFAAHHPGYPIAMVNNLLIPGAIPKDIEPVLLINSEVGAPDLLRRQLADKGAELLGISTAEARRLATLGFALDRITPSRREKEFSLGNVQLGPDGFPRGAVRWSGGETSKKYQLIVTNFKTVDELTLKNVFEETLFALRHEASVAYATALYMRNGVKGKEKEDFERLLRIIKIQSDFEIGETEAIQNKVLALIKGRLEPKGFRGNLLPGDIRIALEMFSEMKLKTDPDGEAMEYLIGVLITIYSSPLAQGHIRAVTSGSKDLQGMITALRGSLLGAYFDIENEFEMLAMSPGTVTETKEKGKDIIVEGDQGQDAYIIVSGEVEVFKKGVKVGVLKEGDIFGEIAAIEGVERTATVKVASEKVEVIKIPDYELKRARSKSEPLRWEIIKLMSQRVERTQSFLEFIRSEAPQNNESGSGNVSGKDSSQSDLGGIDLTDQASLDVLAGEGMEAIMQAFREGRPIYIDGIRPVILSVTAVDLSKMIES